MIAGSVPEIKILGGAESAAGAGGVAAEGSA